MVGESKRQQLDVGILVVLNTVEMRKRGGWQSGTATNVRLALLQESAAFDAVVMMAAQRPRSACRADFVLDF